jgi:hypothetical protein
MPAGGIVFRPQTPTLPAGEQSAVACCGILPPVVTTRDTEAEEREVPARRERGIAGGMQRDDDSRRVVSRRKLWLLDVMPCRKAWERSDTRLLKAKAKVVPKATTLEAPGTSPRRAATRAEASTLAASMGVMNTPWRRAVAWAWCPRVTRTPRPGDRRPRTVAAQRLRMAERDRDRLGRSLARMMDERGPTLASTAIRWGSSARRSTTAL